MTASLMPLTTSIARELKLKITQPLWDFGETRSAIETAGLTSEQANMAIGAVTNAAIMQAAHSYTGLKRAHAQYKISLQAELNMKGKQGCKIIALHEALQLVQMSCRQKCSRFSNNGPCCGPRGARG